MIKKKKRFQNNINALSTERILISVGLIAITAYLAIIGNEAWLYFAAMTRIAIDRLFRNNRK